jgi:bacterial/archaeal transporter family-2 protein
MKHACRWDLASPERPADEVGESRGRFLASSALRVAPRANICGVLPLYIAVVFLAGALIATQAGVNSQLARAAGHPVFAATISFVVGTAALLLCSLALRGSWTGGAALATMPWWIWSGGLLGAVFVVTTAWLAPVLGAATLLSVAIAGQVTFALVLDHYGLVGFPHRPMSPGRVAGVVLLMAGVMVIRRC